MSPEVDAAFNRVVVGRGSNSDQTTAQPKRLEAATHSSVQSAPVAEPTAKSVDASEATESGATPKPTMNDDAINKHLKGLAPKNSGELEAKGAEIQRQIDDPKTPPELKTALKQYKSALFDENPPALNDRQMGALSTLQRHQDELPIKLKDIQKKIDDKDTPPDLKAALIQIRDDPTLAITLDTAKKGGGIEGTDGTIGGKDIGVLSDRPEMKEYNQKKAAGYVDSYIPSDANPAPAGGRKMTENDAMREMYLYSDSLPSDFDRGDLQDIVDGNAKGKKLPPQMIAAAQYLLDNPKSWSKMTQDGDGKPSEDGRVTRSAFLDNVNRNVYLTPGQTATLESLDKNRDVFFSSNMTRDSLKKLVEDPASSDEVKKTAQSLLDDPQLFGMLDNAKTGHRSSNTKVADDGQISTKDIDAYMAMSTTKGKKQPDLPPVIEPKTPAQVTAVADMKAGALDDPDEKKKKGGELTDVFKKIFSPLLKIGAGIMHGISIAVSFLGTIPFLKPFLAPVVMATEGIAAGMDIARAGIEGKDMGQAAALAAVGIAGAAVSAATVGGAGAAVAAGVKAGISKGISAGVQKGAGEAVEAGVAQGAKAGVTKGAGEAAETTGKTFASKSATEGADSSVSQTGKGVAGGETKDQAKKRAAEEAREDYKQDARDMAVDQALAGNTNGQQPINPAIAQTGYVGVLPTESTLVTTSGSFSDARRQQRLEREAQNRAEEEARRAQMLPGALAAADTVIPVTTASV